jgi:hypothetical protein
MKGAGKALVLASLLFAGLFLYQSAEAASTDERTTTSNVTVNVYVSISLTTEFSNGVTFGSLDPGTDDNNATTCNDLGCNISVSGDTNVAVDVVMKANANLTRGTEPEMIPNWNYTWNVTDGSSLPLQPGWDLNLTSYDYRTAYKVGDSVSASGVRSWQGWLDIPSAQTAGTYNNTLYFCANQEDTTDCG